MSHHIAHNHKIQPKSNPKLKFPEDDPQQCPWGSGILAFDLVPKHLQCLADKFEEQAWKKLGLLGFARILASWWWWKGKSKSQDHLCCFLSKIHFGAVVFTKIWSLQYFWGEIFYKLFIKLSCDSVLQLGSVAGSVIQAFGRLEFEDGLRTGVLLHCVTCWTSVRTKLGVNMDTLGEPRVARLSNEVRFGPGGKPSSSKCPRPAVVG